ncbi:MAG: HAD-IC family P-type ATPase, partial [Eubacteriales bacterium]
DIVEFKSGNQIYADGEVLAGEIQVNEALVTGESDDILKRTGDKLISGSFVVSGECRVRLESVGYDSFVSKLTLEAKKGKKQKKTGMMKALTRLLQFIGIAIIPVGILLYIQQTNTLGLTMKAGIENTTAALIGMIPQGLYLLVSVALAVSVVRLSKKKTLVHDLNCIETLARVDVLCVDKTGTITENFMKVADVVPLETSKMSLDAIEMLLADFVGAMSADNSTMQALKEHFRLGLLRPAEKVQAFSSTNKYSAVSFGAGENYTLGAPEFILREQYHNYQENIEAQTAKGYRVLLLAECDNLIEDGTLDKVNPVALVLLENPVRPTARSTFEYFLEQGVEIKVISGDNPTTVAMAAEHAGIVNSDRFIDASTLDTDEKLADAALAYTVFGRVTPVQKQQLIRYLQKAGHTVAMTGDGVNDVLALKAADCSIAMASGSEVASKVSHLVMLGSDFDSMPLVVA